VREETRERDGRGPHDVAGAVELVPDWWGTRREVMRLVRYLMMWTFHWTRATERAPVKVLKERRSHRERRRMGTSAR
jgi:hypothetical protein